MAEIETVMLGLPNLGSINASLAAFTSLLAAKSRAPDSTRRFIGCWSGGRRPVDFARNYVVQKFLSTDATRLWFLDADTVPHPHLAALLDIDADIVAAPVPLWSNSDEHPDPTPEWNVFNYDSASETFYHDDLPAEGIHEVAGVGTACMIIKRHVLEDQRMRVGNIWTSHAGLSRAFTPQNPPAIFHELRMPNGAIALSEDLFFCYRARRLGYSIVASFDLRCGHQKGEIDIAAIWELADRARQQGRDEMAMELSAPSSAPPAPQSPSSPPATWQDSP